jgi:Flp pilus assembly protein TadD
MKKLMLAVTLFALAACSSDAPPPATGRPAAKVDPVALVATVRAAGATGNELEVKPLRDPQVEDLRVQAEALEAQGHYSQASAALNKALEITPADPDLLQWKAELALHLRAWQVAEQLASDSFDKGPKLGGLCRRNWTTVQLARESRGDAAGADVARRQLDRCTVAPPVRM